MGALRVRSYGRDDYSGIRYAILAWRERRRVAAPSAMGSSYRTGAVTTWGARPLQTGPAVLRGAYGDNLPAEARPLLRARLRSICGVHGGPIEAQKAVEFTGSLRYLADTGL